jgi:glycosyltransferase involved in cell wall biosynthesis
MKVIYLGTMKKASGNPTTIHTLTPLLRSIVPVSTVSPFRNKFIRLLDMVRAVLRSRHSDLVLIDTYSTLAFYYAWLCGFICKLRRIKYIAYLHGGNLPNRVGRNSKWLNNFFTDASMIIAPSRYLKHSMEETGIGKVTVIPNFITIANYPYKKRSAVRPRLLWVRAFHKEVYNPEMAIRLLAVLSKQYEDARLCMVGPDKDGNMDSCLELAESLQVINRLKFTGQLSKKEWIQLSAEYDIFVNTSNVDNTPVSVIEAMALGLPVISTNVGGIPFLFEHEQDCLLVNKNDHNEMAGAITRLIDNPQLNQQLTLAARKKAESFDWENIKKLWMQVIDQHD